MTNPFGTELQQTNDWRPSALGLVAGGMVVGSLWFASSRGAELDGQILLIVGIAAAFLGGLLLALKKGSWNPALGWWTETLGMTLVSPLFLSLSIIGLFPIGPWSFAGPRKRV